MTPHEPNLLPLELRRDRIERAVAEQGFARVQDLSLRFAVSEVTVRSDLAELERLGRVRRVRGGAVAVERPVGERPFEETLGDRADEKQAIGHATAALLTSGESVLLDVGSTTAAVAKAIVERDDLEDLVVFTNGLSIALELEAAVPRISVVVTGGTLRPKQHSLVDPLGDLLIDRIHADTVVLGCNGIDPVGGVTNVNLPEAAMKQRMYRRAARRIVVADASKLGRVSVVPLCGLDDVDLLVTSERADPTLLDEFRSHDIHVEVVG